VVVLSILVGIGVREKRQIYQVFGWWRLLEIYHFSKCIQFFCILRFLMGVKGILFVGGAPKMHTILDISRIEHLHLDK